MLLCIGTGKTVNDTERLRYHGDQFYLKTAEEMAAVFPDYADALANTLRIAERCNVDLSVQGEPPPELRRARPASRSTTTSSTWCGAGFSAAAAAARSSPARGALKHTIDEYERRLDYEIDMIKKMDFPGYFLIVWDFIRYAREHGIPVGPGPRLGGRQLRRLLPADHRRRPDRVRPALRALPQPRARVAARHRHRLLRAPPRRGHRVRHAQKYGRENVAQIITFGTMKARAVVRDVARVHGHPVRRRRPHRQGDPAGARHDAGEGARGEPGAEGDGSRRTSG